MAPPPDAVSIPDVLIAVGSALAGLVVGTTVKILLSTEGRRCTRCGRRVGRKSRDKRFCRRCGK
jgi:rRNA maturation endonuclease Nob1